DPFGNDVGKDESERHDRHRHGHHHRADHELVPAMAASERPHADCPPRRMMRRAPTLMINVTAKRITPSAMSSALTTGTLAVPVRSVSAAGGSGPGSGAPCGKISGGLWWQVPPMR